MKKMRLFAVYRYLGEKANILVFAREKFRLYFSNFFLYSKKFCSLLHLIYESFALEDLYSSRK